MLPGPSSVDFLQFHKLYVSPAADLCALPPPVHWGSRQRPLRASLLLQPTVSPVVLAAIPADVQALLAEFPAILRGEDEPPAPTHGIEHHIETTGRPIFSNARRLDSEKLALAQATGKIRYSTPLKLRLVIASPHGKKAQWRMAPLRRLQAPKPEHHPRQVPIAQHAGPG